ncbi:hypothetical protein M0813_27427 [Anaeramoeba flamelloides]|uniref:Endonuclease/exonuclease/phosphatase domain-containing protein n=1 Tax=Anaeramoeba flamelloides TaxID=1746091 RepID=A0ABQ8XVS6_9EUKA|nr:hypothetical protein M0813_27427 [Anaeramoeba flamelloides]
MTTTKTEQSKNTLKISTFNILAPCYKRLNPGRESTKPDLWKSRQTDILDLLSETKSDIFCIQELWFDTLFMEKVKQKFTGYEGIGVKRPNRMDGLGIFVKKSTYNLLDFESLKLNDEGYRVALLAHIQSKSDSSMQFLIVNTHLTFPHTKLELKLRLWQVKRIIKWTKRINSSKNLPVIFTGDFNLIHDNVYRHVKNQGFESCFEQSNKREPYVTHQNHRSEQVCTDFIFLKTGTKCNTKCSSNNSYLLPKGLSDENFPKEFCISDHRPLVSKLSFEKSNK